MKQLKFIEDEEVSSIISEQFDKIHDILSDYFVLPSTVLKYLKYWYEDEVEFMLSDNDYLRRNCIIFEKEDSDEL